MQVSWCTGRGYCCPAVWPMGDTVVWLITHSQAFPFLLRKGAKRGFSTPYSWLYDSPDGNSMGKSYIKRAGQKGELQFLVTGLVLVPAVTPGYELT